MPIRNENGCLSIAVNDPNDYISLSTYQFNTGTNTESVLMSEKDINKIKQTLRDKLTNADLNITNFNVDALNYDASNDSKDNMQSPVIAYVDKILSEAIKRDASDIHLEPYKESFRIRFRQDGLLMEIAKLAIETSSSINSRLKVLANLDISERRVPQDGRFNLSVDEKKL